MQISTPHLIAILSAIETARRGLDYHRRTGAACPWCGARCLVENTLPIEGATRIRYHRCANPACPLHVFKHTIKSIEEV